MGAEWSIAVGFLVYFIAIIFAIVFYVIYRKFSLILYTASISTLIFSIFYAIDVFDFSRNLIMLTLVISTIAFFALGKYFQGVTYTKEN
ncbi:MAG: hypothetical protein LAT82_02445 [Nanoarchaeota archaeon]|nr:hypothetical protein [Nanoarchaeota archaeon]